MTWDWTEFPNRFFMSQELACFRVAPKRMTRRVDLLVGIRGFDAQAFSRAIDVPLDGEPPSSVRPALWKQ
jgi:hypothetical protein